MLSFLGWVNSISVICVVLFHFVIGLFFVYKSIKLKAKLLFFAGLMVFFVGLMFILRVLDFLTIIFTGSNIDNTYGQASILSMFSIPALLLIGIYLGAELIVPKKKRIVVIFFLILGIIFEISLFLDPLNSLTFIYPSEPGEDIVDSIIVRNSPIFYIIIIYLISVLIFNGFGFLSKAIQTTGVFRKKFLILSINFFIFVVLAAIEGYTTPGILMVLVRIGLSICPLLMYIGLKPPKEKVVKSIKIPSYLEAAPEASKISLIETLSRQRPAIIPAEEISLYQEQKLCLVCKGKAEKINIYICAKCNTIYCQNCARALSDIENMCWVCGEPFDSSKPVKPFKEEEEEEEVIIEEKSQKKENKKQDAKSPKSAK